MFKGVPLTLGVEEEYQIIDAESRALDSYVSKILPDGRVRLQDQVKEEFMMSQIEVGSQVCANIDEVRAELCRLRGALIEIAELQGKRIVAAGTHPFSRWMEQTITPRLRYKALEENMQDIARRLLIFGMHVHVGIGDLELTIDIFNQARYFLPHLLALSCSSPFWDGRRTGLMSYRSVVFETLPRTGIPDSFESYADYDRFMSTLERVGVIDDRTKVWWDIRPHPKYKTLEFRVCDVCTRIDDAVCLAAMIQALVAFLIDLRLGNRSWRIYHRDLIRENKWRAVRHERALRRAFGGTTRLTPPLRRATGELGGGQTRAKDCQGRHERGSPTAHLRRDRGRPQSRRGLAGRSDQDGRVFLTFS
jgi:carboxylate-amine ligase